MPDTSFSPCIQLVPFKLPSRCYGSEGASQSRWVHVWVSQEELLRAPEASSTNSVPAGFHSQKLWGFISLALESWAGGFGVDLGLLAPEISLPSIYPHGCGASLFHICTPPTSPNGCGFFSFVVVRHIQLHFWCSWVVVVPYFSWNVDMVVYCDYILSKVFDSISLSRTIHCKNHSFSTSCFLFFIYQAVSYTHLTLPTIILPCRSRWSPYH